MSSYDDPDSPNYEEFSCDSGRMTYEEKLIEQYEETLKDHRRLVRELDAILSGGPEFAAKQASLCDLLPVAQKLVNELNQYKRIQENDYIDMIVPVDPELKQFIEVLMKFDRPDRDRVISTAISRCGGASGEKREHLTKLLNTAFDIILSYKQ